MSVLHPVTWPKSIQRIQQSRTCQYWYISMVKAGRAPQFVYTTFYAVPSTDTSKSYAQFPFNLKLNFWQPRVKPFGGEIPLPVGLLRASDGFGDGTYMIQKSHASAGIHQ